ncbi:MAG: hypothetical protein BGO32_04170 [Bacteroidetes bacterium 37-13]|nr:MAG: hypothetical protein BGO32_04170 [Bacteroidetes bacterium 37-13]
MNPIFNLMKPQITKWTTLVVSFLLAMWSFSANAATYYWVQGSGNWSDLHHWAATSNGSGHAFQELPDSNDIVIFDRYSFTGSLQVVTVDVAATCATIDCRNATYTYKSSSNAPSLKVQSSLSIFGDIITTSVFKFVNNSNIYFKGTGAKALNIPSAITGTGNLKFNSDSGTWTLVCNLTSTSGNIYLEKGTLNTNGKTVSIRSFISNSGENRVLNMGSSYIKMYCVSSTTPLWDMSNSNGLTLNAGSSNIEFYSSSSNGVVSMQGGNLSYNKITVNLPISSPTKTNAISSLTIEGNNTINTFVATKGNLLFNGDNTFVNSVSLAANARHRFKYGTTQFFGASTTLSSAATQTYPVYLQSTSTSNAANFSKPSGIVCAGYIYINGIRAIGGASWNSISSSFNQAPVLNAGWNFASATSPASVTLEGGTKCRFQPFELKFTFSETTYPIEIFLQDSVSGKIDTIRDVTNSTFYYPVNPTVTTTYKVLKLSSTGCATHTTNFTNVQAVVSLPSAITSARWVGRKSADWYDCYNWFDFNVPADTVNTVIEPNSDSIQPIISSGIANTQRLEIAYDADLTLIGPTTELNVYGDFVNNGRFHPNNAKVSFIGNDVSLISGGIYSNLTINNTTPEGISIQDTVTVSGTLTLNNGIVKTNGNLISVTNPAVNAITNYGEDNYVNGALERTISDTGSFAFPVGDDIVYALCEIRPRGGTTGGVTKIKVQFINKPGTDDGLNLQYGDVQINTVHPAGIWLIEPDQQPNFGVGGELSGDYELIFDVSSFAGLENYDFYILTRGDTSTSASDWTLAGTQNGAAVQDGKIVVSGITHFSQWGVGSGGGLLPVKMSSFKAVPVDNKFIQLQWTTETEINNRGFSVERSTDAKEFAAIGYVQGNGNSTETINYTYNDKNVELNKRYYYRLKQVDFDESFEYTKIASAVLNDKTEAIRIGEFIPNPASITTKIDIDVATEQDATFSFRNATGQTVKSIDIILRKELANYEFNVEDLASGNYIVSIKTNDDIYVRKLLIK